MSQSRQTKAEEKYSKNAATSATTSPSERLPSLKPKRDLTLGGVKKRVFTPTVPARRLKKQPQPPENEGKMRSPVPLNTDHPRSDGRSKGDRDKQGKGSRKKREVITASSVFSLGPAERLLQSRREMATFGRTSSLSSHREQKTVKVEAGEKDQSKTSLDMDLESMVVQTSNDGHHMFLDSLMPPIKLPLDCNLHNKPPLTTVLHAVPDSKIKIKKESSIEEMEVDVEKNPDPIKLAEPVITSHDSSVKHTIYQIDEAQLFTPSKDQKGMFLLFQFPDSLPLPTPGQHKDKQNTSKAAVSDKGNNEKTQDLPISNPSLHDVPMGVIGKIRVCKSRNVKLVLGDISLDVAMGTRGGFLQELSSVNVSKPPSITTLGQLSHKLVCVPDLMSCIEEDR